MLTIRIVASQQVSHRTLEGADELATDDLALALRISHAGQCFQESLLRVDRHKPGTGGRHEITLHLFAFAGAQQSVIDEHTGKPVADGSLDQCGRHRGIHPAGQSADGPAWADLLANAVDE